MTEDELGRWFKGGSSFALVFFFSSGEIAWRSSFTKDEPVVAVVSESPVRSPVDMRWYPVGTRAYLGSPYLRIGESDLEIMHGVGHDALVIVRYTWAHGHRMIDLVLRNYPPGFRLDTDRCHALLEMGVDHIAAVKASMV